MVYPQIKHVFAYRSTDQRMIQFDLIEYDYYTKLSTQQTSFGMCEYLLVHVNKSNNIISLLHSDTIMSLNLYHRQL